MLDDYHIPVLGQEICAKLLTNLNGNYYDGTLGGGGHAELILNHLTPSSHYIAVDRDSEAISFAFKRLGKFSNITFYQGIFSSFGPALEKAGISDLDGVLLDLGVSSHQIDNDQRGFAFRPGVALDMRMNANDETTAADILATYEQDALKDIFKKYGEERHAGRIAKEIVARRASGPIRSSEQLMQIIQRCVPGKFLTKSYARIFQALRIEVNQELKILEDALAESLNYLKTGGRIAVLSYHSLEDRIVKVFLQEQENPCTCPPDLPYCVCGKKPVMKRIKPSFITASEQEIKQNPRARSAKMRVGEKL